MLNNDFTPRPKASQDVAAAHRQRPTVDDPLPVAPQRQLFAVGTGVVILCAMLAISWQLAQTPPKPLNVATPVPTVPATLAPALLSVPTALPSTPVLPTVTPVVPEPSQEAAAPVGQGLTWVEPTAVPVAPPSYIEVVGAQAPHSPRGDGQPGPKGGDHVLVPTLTSQQLVIVGAQTPHKVR